MKANVTDLEIEKQLLPLFDTTGNTYARRALTHLLLTLPDTQEGVYERQRLLKAFIDNGYIHTEITYSRQDFEEVLHSFTRINDQYYYYDSNHLIATAQLLWRRRYRHSMRSRLAQLALFMEGLQIYFEQIDPALFPSAFGERITALQQYLSMFHAKEVARRIRKDRFGVRDQLFLLDLLNRKIDEKTARKHWETFYEFEAWLSLAKGIVKRGFVFPEFTAAGVQMKDFYHPALQQPVKNDLDTTGTVMLLTGPNMSGKSTLLKAIGICVYLAHAGVGVPASYCRLPYFDSITVIINLSDDLKHGYSHFMMEVQHLKNVVQEAHGGKRCFAVFDELFRGTNVDDALDISQQTINGLNKFHGSFFVISTHLYQLQPLLRAVNAWYIDCILKDQVPQFLYRLRAGWSDLKIGRIIFEKEGLPALLQRT
ncbi:MutS-related protein [Chitinophaga sp.]|uniref:MutS-related protein n=1 Tax=Chitinophaga sp. TaxID=1869181 RepID=UPI002F921886